MERIEAAANSRLMRLVQKMIVRSVLFLDRFANSPSSSLSCLLLIQLFQQTATDWVNLRRPALECPLRLEQVHTRASRSRGSSPPSGVCNPGCASRFRVSALHDVGVWLVRTPDFLTLSFLILSFFRRGGDPL